MLSSTPSEITDLDEHRHPDVAVEAWWWWATADDRQSGAFVGFELRGRRFDYWAGLVRSGEPYLYIEELDGSALRDGLEIKPPQMWADHVCDAPFLQWSIGNEAHGVLLDDPTEAWRRAFGTLAPATFDIEWAAPSGSANALTRIPNGYHQTGEADVEIQLTEGFCRFSGPAERVHVWGIPYVPSSFAMPITVTQLRAPYRRTDGRHVDQVLTDRWYGNVVGPA